MPDILCTSLNSEAGPHWKILEAGGFGCKVVSRQRNLFDEAQMIDALQGFQAVIAGAEPFTRRVIESSELRVIARTGVGYDAIDLAACDERGIVVCITPGVNHDSVAEHTIAMLMAIARGFPRVDQQVRACHWVRVARPRVLGSTLGLVGLGRIGRAVAWRAAGLGMNVIAYDPVADAAFADRWKIQIVSLEDLLRESDYVSLHLPMSSGNRRMINRKALALMKPGSVLINTSRGQLVDEQALIESLEAGHLRAAGLDVFEVEPLPTTSRLLKMDNVLLSGHVAGLDSKSHDDTFAMAANLVLQLYRGEWPSECIVNLKSASAWKW